MKTGVWILGIILAAVAVAFVARPEDRLLAEHKVDACDCRVLWRYSAFSLDREFGSLIFASQVDGKKKEKRAGFSGDWSGNTLIEWKQLSIDSLEASDRYSGVRGVFKSDGSIKVVR